jgi:hypothetical protein
MKTIEQAAKNSAFETFPTMMTKEFRPIYEQGFKAGIEFAQRWIPTEEELPPLDQKIIVKFINFRNEVDYWTGTLHTEERMRHFLDQHLKFTHWRLIELQ